MAMKRGKVVTIEYDDTTTSIIVSDLDTTANIFATTFPLQLRSECWHNAVYHGLG